MDAGSSGPGEAKLVQQVRAALQRTGLSTSALMLVGFSGGRDSTALLAALRSIAPRLHAVHVDHAIRAESAVDASRALALADQLGVALTVRRLDGDVAAQHPGAGLEEALRRERYRVFAEVAVSLGADVVALGHHAQDQAETVLLHLLRGSGLSGGVGMRELSTIEVPWWGVGDRRPVRVWRPLLEALPRDLDAFISALGVSVIADASNEDRRFRRNAIRHDVLPLLEKVSPGAIGNLARFGSLVGDEDVYLDSVALNALGDSDVVAREVVLAQPVVIQRRMIRHWLRRQVGDVEVSRERVAAVVSAIGEHRGRKVIEIGGGWSVEIGRDVVRMIAHR